MKRIIPLALCFLLIISFTFTQPVFSAGETITWTGDVGDGLWHTAGNWNPAQVPGDGDLVIIPELADVVYEGGETTVILNCAGNLTVSDGALKVYGSSTLTNGKLDGAGDIIIHSGDLNWTGGNIEGTGKLIIDYNQELYAKASASLDRYLECRNNGKLFINNSLRLTGGAEGGGDITIHEGQTLELAGNGSYDLSDLNINNSGTLKIANTCEFVRFKYDFTQQNTGTLEFDIGGPDDFTKLEVGDEATLYGKLKINILDGYVPQPGDTFEIITYNKKYGTFSSIVSNIDDITFVPVYNATSLTLTVAAKAENVCKIGATEYATLDDALAAVQSGETIELLRDIDYVKDVVYNGAIFIDGTDITIDLNGYTLNVNNSRGPGIKVRNGGKVKCINGETTGSFNVTGYEYGVWAEGAGTVVRVNNITSRGSTAYNYGVLAIDSAEVIVENDIVVSGYSSRGVAANDGVVTVKGYVSLTEGSGESVGLNVFNEGRVVVEGSVNVSGYAVKGIIAESNASVDISGDVTAMGDGSIGISSKEAHVYVDGDVVGKRMGISARKASVIHVAGNVTSTAGNPTTEGSSRGIEINDECQIIVEGNVQSNDTGVNIIVNDPAQHTPSEIYIDGEITAPKYISIWGTSLGYEDYNGITPSGYRIYEVITDGSGGSYTLGTVFVKVEGVIPVAPTAPQDFIATPGDGQVMLSWIPPGNNGGSAIRKYEVSKDDGENWINVGLNTSYTFTGLTNGTEYIFKVRAVNGVGAGAEASATATPVASTTPFPTQPGRLYTWGRNQDGQMGDGTQIDKWIPTHIGTDEDWVAISTGASHTAALKADGSLWTWGDNHYGKLGDGTEELRQRSPVRIGSDNDWVAVDAGDDFTVALKADGSLWAWGYAMGGFEYGGSSKNWNVPTLVDNENKWIAVSAGSQHTVAIKEDGTLWGWGFNIYGELGSSDFDNYIDYTKSPVQISSNRWIAVSAGEYFTVGLKEDGSLWAWGRNDLGQLGDGSVADKFIPTRVGSDTWLAAAAGTDHVVAIKADGSLWAWGGNQYGELGNGSSDGITDPPPHPNPAQIGTDTDWSFVTAGYNHNAAIKRDGSIWLWGLGTLGRLGDGTTASKTTPQRLDVIGTWVAAACGDGHTAAILKAELTVPTAPQNFTATPGDGQVALSWTAPASDGGSAITKYQVSKDDGANWTDVGLNTTYTFTGLTNGTTYTFKVRAVNGAGNGAEASTTATPVAAPISGSSGRRTVQTPVYQANIRTVDGTEKVLLVTVGRDVGTVFIEEDPWSTRPQGKMVITMPSIPGVDTYSVGIPVPDLSTSDVMGRLTVDTEAGSVTVPSNMLTGVSGISGNKAVIAIGQGDKENLPDEVKTVIGDRPLISINLSVDGKTINWSNPNAPVTVSIPYTPTAEELANPESIVIWYIDGSGNVVSVPNGRYDSDAGTVTFTTTHLSDFAVAYNPVEFNDVPEDVWCHKAVCFIAAREISKGTGNGNYSPESNLTRGDFIVLMMRAYGMVPDENPVDNFSDAGNTYYTGYLAAAKRLGITSGVGDNMFAPKKQITRQEMITLLHNALNLIGQLPQGSSGKTLMDFTDAAEVAPWAKDAMSDFVGSGVVYGSGGKLNPTSTTSRAEIAQVLYNLLCN